MSNLTMKLLQRPIPSLARRWKTRLHAITETLVATYGTPSLGNHRDPVQEILYIALSAKTTEALYKTAYERLRIRHPDLAAIAGATERSIRNCIGSAGLGFKRSRQVKAIAIRLLNDFDTRPATALRKLPPREAFRYLCSLPGIGPKSALCVMMYSLGHDVFPVDTHVHRVLHRVGAIKSGVKHYQAQNVLPALVPAAHSKALHIGLIVHGRSVCRSHKPRCGTCCIRRFCHFSSR